MIVIAGGGLAAQRCCERLRRKGYDGPITMVCDEPCAPYDRPPLSKQFLSGHITEAPRLRPDDWYAENDMTLLLGERAAALRPRDSELELGSGEVLRYDQLLIATGAAPRELPGVDGHVLRTLADAERLRDSLSPGTRLAVIGAGFIGQEVTSTACKLGADVTLFEALAAPLAHIVGEQVGGWFAQLHRDHGVDVRTSATFEGEFDEVVVGIGVTPATAWLRGTAIGPNGKVAIQADHAGRTCIPNVFAAGDCAGSQHWEARYSNPAELPSRCWETHLLLRRLRASGATSTACASTGSAMRAERTRSKSTATPRRATSASPTDVMAAPSRACSSADRRHYPSYERNSHDTDPEGRRACMRRSR